MRVAVRADASARIGAGHVMRCLTLAEALRERGAEVHFVCRAHAGHMAARIEAAGFPVSLLPAPPPALAPVADADYAAWLGVPAETDAHETVAALDGWRPHWLIVDHYALDARWERALRPHCERMLVIDDLADRDHDADLLLDQNLVADMDGRYDGRVPPHCGRLLGPDYALLQPGYAELHPRTPPRTGRIQRIFVFFGMADGANLTGRTIAAFLALQRPDIGLDVVIDPESAHAAALREQATAHGPIALHGPLPSLAPLMMKADLAIGAAGATSWERCCLGLPSLVVTLAENQTPIAAALDRQRCIRWLGHRDTVSDAMLTSALQEALLSGLASEMSRRGLALVDGRGTERVAGIMALSHETPLTARLARVDDEALILRWANDPLVRRNAFNPAAIDPEGHRAWFYQRLRDPDGCRIYIVETDHGLPIGQVRFELSDDGWSIDYALDACARGRKLGANLLQTALHAFRRSMNGVLVFGRVKPDNRPSRTVFERLGFTAEAGGGSLSIAVCSDTGSWINGHIPALLLGWMAAGHRCAWGHAADQLPGGDLCFYLSYGRIVDRRTRERYENNLVVHESALPNGKGWSPLTWQILEGRNAIPVTLFEAAEHVDSGPIYAQRWITFRGHELIDELRAAQAEASFDLCRWFVAEYPDSVAHAREQTGEESVYPRRRPADSRLDPDRTLRDHFNLMRVVDNDRYPAFVHLRGHRYRLAIHDDGKDA